MAQPVKKKEIKPFDLSAYKKKTGVGGVSSADKELDWIIMPDAFKEAIKLPGIPKGYVCGVRGWQDTGKSTLVNCAIAAAQKQGILPIIFDTEGNFDFNYAIDCGVEAEPIYGEVEEVDPETGEVSIKTKIVDWSGNFIFMHPGAICDAVGDNDYTTHTKKKEKRDIPVIEDIAFLVNMFLNDQANGELECDLLFIWDSIGSIPSWKSYTSKAGNNQFDAAAMQQAFGTIANIRIPSSRKLDRKYTNTMFVVNKIWNDAMNSMGGAPSIENKGGKMMGYAERLLLHVGGVAKSATKKLKATSKGEEYQYGIVTKIQVVKNQLPTPYNVTYSGTMCCVHNGIVSEDNLNAYKKKYMPEILERMNKTLDINLSVGDITFSETDSEMEQ